MDTTSLQSWIREKGGRPGNFVWAPHPRDVWALAYVAARIDDAADRFAPPTLELEFADGTRPSPSPLPLARTQEFDAAHVAAGCADARGEQPQRRTAADIVRRRFIEDLIYTRASNVLISVNPSPRSPASTTCPRPCRRHRRRGASQRRPRRPPPPHVFSVAEAAFCAMLGGAQDQSVVERRVGRGQDRGAQEAAVLSQPRAPAGGRRDRARRVRDRGRRRARAALSATATARRRSDASAAAVAAAIAADGASGRWPTACSSRR